MESTTENKKSLTRHGDSEAPPTHPMRPEKNKVKPNPMTTYVNICNTKMQQRVIASPNTFCCSCWTLLPGNIWFYSAALEYHLTKLPSRNRLTVTEVARTQAMYPIIMQPINWNWKNVNNLGEMQWTRTLWASKLNLGK